jgi:translation initiation factor IF-2
VKTELMQYELVGEEFGGEVIMVEVSAKTGQGLARLEEAILLQAEILELRANATRSAAGTVIESRIDRGRGVVATLLVQKGTLRVGDILVAGATFGRVRAILDDKGRPLETATLSMPIEILGLAEPPDAGDEFAAVENEKTARDITEYRQQRNRSAQSLLANRSLESMFAASAGAKSKELPVIIKSDVQGSAEAIAQSMHKFDSTEVSVRVLHAGVGAITESDITLANATRALVVGFNVRATSQARDMATRDKINLRYYSVIYDVVEDIKAALSGMLSPTLKENFLGYAQIREVFNLTKAGKVAGCMVTEGVVKRGSKVRLLRDNVVIHNGTLKTLKRFKEDVREVTQGMECGMAFENYEDIRNGDMIEAYEIEEVARTV